MTRNSRYSPHREDLNIFQSFTDLMTNAFLILSFFLLLALLHSWELNRKLQSASPIVIDEKSGNFKFSSGSAELNRELKTYIEKQIIPAIEKTTRERAIDFIQVIGHTDGQAIQQNGNLDKNIESVARNARSVGTLIPGSNTDLGLMRALAVIQEIQKSDKLKNIKFRAYSAGQLYLPSGELALVDRSADSTRRRIEIRFIPPGKKQ